MNAKSAIRKTKTSISRPERKAAAKSIPARKSRIAASGLVKTLAVVSKRQIKKTSSTAVAQSSLATVPEGKSKQARLVALLKQESGANINQMMTLTGWQAHTVRGTISGVLRKKLGLNVTCMSSHDSGPRLYRIVEAAVGV